MNKHVASKCDVDFLFVLLALKDSVMSFTTYLLCFNVLIKHFTPSFVVWSLWHVLVCLCCEDLRWHVPDEDCAFRSGSHDVLLVWRNGDLQNVLEKYLNLLTFVTAPLWPIPW